LCTGGTQSAGGIGGISAYTSNNNGFAGTLSIGGSGGTEIGSSQVGNNTAFTGGVGGGLNGGAGQYTPGVGQENSNFCGSSGAGGSSYVGTLLNGYTTSGNVSGNGEVMISYSSIGVMTLNFLQAYICLGGSATLTAPSQVSYTWSTGSNASSIIVSPTVNTSYSVSGTNSLGCVSLGVITVTVDGNSPSVTINSSSNSVCQGNTVTLSGSGAISYTWSGGVSNGSPFIPSSTSNYTVTGANGCGTATALVTVSVNPNPTLSVNTGSVALCPGNSTTLTATGANSFTWTGGISNGIAFNPPASNIYTVTGNNTFGCIGTSTVAVTVLPSPSVTPVPSSSVICVGQTSTISATGASNYTWMPGASNSSSITVSPTISTVYSVTQSIGNCVDIKTISVGVLPLPTVTAFVSNTAICSGMPVTFTASGANSYSWSNNVQNGVAYFPSITSTYTVTGLGQNGCTAKAVAFVSVTPTPSLTPVASQTSICLGGSAILSAFGASGYTWMPGNFNSATVSVSPSVATTYTLVKQNGSCFDTKTISITVMSTPVIQINGPASICAGQSATMTASGALNYTWSAPAGITSTGQSYILSPTSTAVYTVIGTSSTNSCVSSATVQTVVFIPTVSVSSPSAICAGSTATLTAFGANSYTWNPNFTPIPSQTIQVAPVSNTVYYLAATSTSAGVNCVSNHSVALQVNNLPNLNISATKLVLCANEPLSLFASGASTYTWNGGQTGATLNIMQAQYSQTFVVTGTSTAGCVSSASISVSVSKCLGIAKNSGNEFRIFPNPSDGILHIQSERGGHFSLVNDVGQILRNFDVERGTEYKITGLASGVYFVIGEGMRKPVKVIVFSYP
jgi:hypothetical protein